jgi:hypothetical protein
MTEEEIESYICPNTPNCPIFLKNHYGMNSLSIENLDPILKNEQGKYSCNEMNLFKTKSAPERLSMTSFDLSDCALIKMMNDNKEILALLKPRESVGGPR